MAYDKNRRRPAREDDGTLMEGRIAAIRSALNAEGFTRVSLLSYTPK